MNIGINELNQIIYPSQFFVRKGLVYFKSAPVGTFSVTKDHLHFQIEGLSEERILELNADLDINKIQFQKHKNNDSDKENTLFSELQSLISNIEGTLFFYEDLFTKLEWLPDLLSTYPIVVTLSDK